MIYFQTQSYTKIFFMYAERNNTSLTVFLNWQDYERFKRGEVIGTRYNGEAKVELIPLDEHSAAISWKVADQVKKLGNDDYCIGFSQKEAACALIGAHSFPFVEPHTNQILAVRICWPSHLPHGYHEDIQKTQYYH